MSAFLTGLDIRLISDTQGVWELKEPLSYLSGAAGRIITVHPGFRTDFASVPRLPLAYLLAGDTCHQAAALHDYLYHTGELSRAMADLVLYEAAGASGEAWWRRALIYAAVRVFGGPFYQGKK